MSCELLGRDPDVPMHPSSLVGAWGVGVWSRRAAGPTARPSRHRAYGTRRSVSRAAVADRNCVAPVSYTAVEVCGIACALRCTQPLAVAAQREQTEPIAPPSGPPHPMTVSGAAAAQPGPPSAAPAAGSALDRTAAAGDDLAAAAAAAPPASTLERALPNTFCADLWRSIGGADGIYRCGMIFFSAAGCGNWHPLQAVRLRTANPSRCPRLSRLLCAPAARSWRTLSSRGWRTAACRRRRSGTMFCRTCFTCSERLWGEVIVGRWLWGGGCGEGGVGREEWGAGRVSGWLRK